MYACITYDMNCPSYTLCAAVKMFVLMYACSWIVQAMKNELKRRIKENVNPPSHVRFQSIFFSFTVGICFLQALQTWHIAQLLALFSMYVHHVSPTHAPLWCRWELQANLVWSPATLESASGDICQPSWALCRHSNTRGCGKRSRDFPLSIGRLE